MIMNTPPSKLTTLWNRLSDFLHHAKLIPLVVMVEGWHYYQVLSSHDTLLAAIPLALFLDLLHVRTVQQAVETKKRMWIAAACISTAVAYAFQYIFYSTPGHNGEILPLWEQLLFAAVVPLGIAFMVWHHHENAQKVERDLLAELTETLAILTDTQALLVNTQDDLAHTQVILVDTQTELTETQMLLANTQGELIDTQTALAETQAILKQTKAKQTETQVSLTETQTRLADALQELTETQTILIQTQVEQERLTEELAAAQEVLKVWEGMNPRMQLAAQVQAGLVEIQEAAALAEVSYETMRRDVVRMNGG